jgi:Zn-dependent metalloprotease
MLRLGLGAVLTAATLITLPHAPVSAGEPTPDPPGARVSVHNANLTDAALSFLTRRKGRYRIADPSRDLRPAGSSRTGAMVAERFDQRYNGIPVLGSQYVVRLTDQGSSAVVTGTSGKYFSGLDVATDTGVSASLSRVVALHALPRPASHGPAQTTDHGLVIVPFGHGILTRHITVATYDDQRNLPVRMEMYVGAGRTRPVLSYDSISYDGPTTTTGVANHSPTLPLQVLQTGSTYTLQDQTKPMFASTGGTIRTYDAHGIDASDFGLEPGLTPGPVLVGSGVIPFPASLNKQGALDAHWGAGKVYDFYANLGRDSLDGKGGSIVSVVGATDDGGPFPNAFWDGSEMVYGAGGYGYKPFSAALDVVGHEMTHAVVQHSAGLLFFGQEGALNEALADYFGNAIEDNTLNISMSSPLGGLMGQDLCVKKVGAACADRNLDKLNTTSHFDGSGFDDGGVHANSTIVSGAFWETRKILGAALGDKVMYAVMTQYLTPMSEFMDARRATLEAAQSLGATAAQVTAIGHAFDKRGVVQGWEKKFLHLDGRTLMSNLTYGGAPAAGDGRWVIADTGPNAEHSPEIFAGTVTGGGPKRISPSNPDVIYDTPATDGRTVIWTATWLRANSTTTRVQTRSLSGGPVRTLATYRNGLIFGTGISGHVATWSGFTGHSEAVWVKRPGGRIVKLQHSRHRQPTQPTVRGNQVVYVDTDARFKPRTTAKLMSYDAGSGVQKVLAAVKGIGHSDGELWSPQITPSYVVFLADARIGGKEGLLRVDRNGHHLRTLIPERSKLATSGYGIAASDRAVTYQTFSFGTGLVHLLQLTTRGGGPVRVSCARGSQPVAVAGRQRRVLWVDLSAGRADLVTRANPVGSC